MHEGLSEEDEAHQMGQAGNFRIYDTAARMGYCGSFGDFGNQVEAGVIDPHRIGIWASRDDPATGGVRAGCAGGLAALLSIPISYTLGGPPPESIAFLAMCVSFLGYNYVAGKIDQGNRAQDVVMLENGNQLLGK